MRLSPPKRGSWTLAFLLGLLGIIAHEVNLPILSGYSFWLVVSGFALLLLATILKGL
jgi:heme/copper-type cytochrome/quinol oxidase subunit 1